MIYLDNAATSGRKPEAVYEAINRALRECSGNPGRSGHKVSLEAGQIVQETRFLCSRLFNAESPETIAFCCNATDALNLAIHGSLKPGDHVITSQMEHNSVARPLETLKGSGVNVTKIRTDTEHGVEPVDVADAIRSNTKMVVLTHVSNVLGTVNDIGAIGRICREAGVTFLVDAAQSAGAMNIDVQKMNIDMLAFPGHKCLFGPQGTGGLYIRQGVDLQPLKQGGTGSKSEMLLQPEQRPDRYESGTLNVPGIAGLGAGISFLAETGMDAVEAKEKALIQKLVKGLDSIAGVHLYGPGAGTVRGSVVSFTMKDQEPMMISLLLDQIFDIAVRAGLHCAPDAHALCGTLGTGGMVRVSPGFFTTEEEIDVFLDAVESL